MKEYYRQAGKMSRCSFCRNDSSCFQIVKMNGIRSDYDAEKLFRIRSPVKESCSHLGSGWKGDA